MTNSNLRVVTPITENRTVTPQRAPNAELRTREHLTADEVEKLIEAAKANRYGYRDALMVLLAYRHGLRAAEVVDLRWGAGRLQNRDPAHPAGPRTAPRPPILSAGVRCASSVAISGKARNPRLCLSQSAAHRYRRRLLPHDRAGSHRGRSGHQGARSHAAPRLRLQARQRRPRHACDPGVSRTSQYPEYDTIYRLGAAAVQGVFSRLRRRGDHKRQARPSAAV